MNLSIDHPTTTTPHHHRIHIDDHSSLSNTHSLHPFLIDTHRHHNKLAILHSNFIGVRVIDLIHTALCVDTSYHPLPIHTTPHLFRKAVA